MGDLVLAIDSHPIQHFNVDVLLKENKNDCVTLTIRRNSISDYLYESPTRQNAVTYANYDAATNTFGGYGNNNNNMYELNYGNKQDNNNYILKNFRRSNESQMKFKNDLQDTPGYYEEPHYSVVPAPRYWNTLKANKNEHQPKDIMGNAISTADLVNYNSVDFSTAQQKMMSLSMGPTTNISHGTQTDSNGSSLANHQNNNINTMASSFIAQQPNVFNVQLHPNGGPLGVTLAGNEDGQKPIIISGLQEGGIAFNTGQVQVGDTLLAVNNESVIGIPLSNATKLLQVQDVIELRLSRSNQMASSTVSMAEKLPLYAEVNRRPNNTIKPDSISNSSSRSGSNNSDGQLKTIHVTLFKDQVYDDYGFSVSDGLYERGVYINRVRSGGPADQVGVLKPYDRIIQVWNGMILGAFVLLRKNSLISGQWNKDYGF